MTATQAIQTIYKKHFPKMVVALARYTGLRDLATVEDIVSEAFAEAARKWDEELPRHPEAWLYRVCRNIALSRLRQARRFETTSIDEAQLSYQLDVELTTDHSDEQLSMLLACIHPSFSSRNQVVFALRYVAGFRVEQIANILGSPADSVTKALFRMRERIARENLSLNRQAIGATPGQAETLHKIIYLMFSEGYKTSGGRSVLNLELCEDALGLALDVSHHPDLALRGTHALIALMLFNLSRFDARFDDHGDLVELEQQDRTKWNQDLIRVGVHHMSMAGDEPTSYHVEATIAWLHASSPSFAATDWHRIASLYDRLIAFNDSPFVRMNQSIALFYAGEVLTALHQLTRLGESAFMQNHYLLHLALGKIYQAMNEDGKSSIHLRRALELSPHESERRHIRKLIDSRETGGKLTTIA